MVVTLRGVALRVRQTEEARANFVVNTLRSWAARETGEISHQLYVIISYPGDWRYFQRANDQAAEAAEFTEISRDVGSCSGYGGCTLTAQFGIGISDTVLRQLTTAEKSALWKAYSQSGHSMLVELSPEMAQKQIEAIDAWKAKVGKPSSQP